MHSNSFPYNEALFFFMDEFVTFSHGNEVSWKKKNMIFGRKKMAIIYSC